MAQEIAMPTNQKNIIKITLLTFLALFLTVSTALAGQSNEWKNQEFKVNGTWSIEQRADGNYLIISDDFKTRSAPDLKLFLSKNDYTDITGRNATKDSVLVSALDSNKGGQSYKLPSEVNLDEYKSLIIHCEQYSKLWASTPLK